MNRIKLTRESLGLSQKFVAVSVGVSPASVSMWESGTKDPTRENLIKLADLFGVSVDYLLERETAGQAVTVTPEELQLLRAYRAASPDTRKAAQAVLGIQAQEKSANVG